jgi:hypothetical protein
MTIQGISPDANQRMQDMEARFKTLEDRQNLNQIQMALIEQNNQIQLRQHSKAIEKLQGSRTALIRDCAVAGGKIVLKMGAKEAVFQIGKQFSVAIAKRASFVTASKVIPIVSVVVGVGLAVFRTVKGYKTGDKLEYVKAVGELASGIFACFPGIGTAGSILVDLGLVGHDVYRHFHPLSSKNAESESSDGELTLQEAYQGLNISVQDASREEVDAAYRILSDVHPDIDAAVSNNDREDLRNALTQFMIRCREVIYRERGWAAAQ